MQRIIVLLVLASFSGLAGAGEAPHRKAGLWEIAMKEANGEAPARKQHVCLDRETDALLNRMGLQTGHEACAKLDLRVQGNRMTIHAVCSFGKSQLTSDDVTTYDGDTSFHAETKGKFEPPMAGTAATHTMQDGKWLSACPAGMKPGDLVILPDKPGGKEIRMNLAKMVKARA